MPTIPYLHFRGQCAEALQFYADVFGGTNLRMMRYGEAPGASEDWKASGNIMHGEVHIFGEPLMASDFAPGSEGDPQKAVSVMQTIPDVATGQVIYDKLCEGGAVIHPYGPSFVAPGFGMMRDKFGTHWILAAGQTQEPK